MPEPVRQRVVGLIGCPGVGKTTYARRFGPLDGWVHLTLDDLRQALWPPDRQVYWAVRGGGLDGQAHRLLHAVKVAALDTALAQGFSVVMADTHLTRAVFEDELEIVARHGLPIEWKLFDVPWEVLRTRNEARGAVDPSHRQPEAVLRFAYDAVTAPDAWWRSLPPGQVETIRTLSVSKAGRSTASQRADVALSADFGPLLTHSRTNGARTPDPKPNLEPPQVKVRSGQ